MGPEIESALAELRAGLVNQAGAALGPRMRSFVAVDATGEVHYRALVT